MKPQQFIIVIGIFYENIHIVPLIFHINTNHFIIEPIKIQIFFLGNYDTWIEHEHCKFQTHIHLQEPVNCSLMLVGRSWAILRGFISMNFVLDSILELISMQTLLTRATTKKHGTKVINIQLSFVNQIFYFNRK